MTWMYPFLYPLFWLFALLCAGFFYLQQKKRIRALLLGSGTGLTMLLLLHFFGGAAGFAPTLCPDNLLLCSIFGIPGVAVLALGYYFL